VVYPLDRYAGRVYLDSAMQTPPPKDCLATPKGFEPSISTVTGCYSDSFQLPLELTLAQRLFLSRIDTSGDCWLWQAGLDGCGYGKVATGGHHIGAHRIAYQLFVGLIPPGKCVMHRCDTPRCVRPSHLCLGTQYENTLDSVAKRRHAWGERNGHARLVEAQVLELRRLWREDRLPQGELARRFGIHKTKVNEIIHYRRWRYLP